MSTTVRCPRVDWLESINILQKGNPGLLEKKTRANMSKRVMSNKCKHRFKQLGLKFQFNTDEVVLNSETKVYNFPYNWKIYKNELILQQLKN